MIRALVFDWGGVIQRTEEPAPRQALEAELGLAPGGLDRAVFGSDVWALASTGRCSVVAAWSQIVASVGFDGGVRAFVERFFAGDRLDPRLLDLIRRCRSEGYRLALLSNAPPPLESGRTVLARWGDPSLFDVQVFSYQVGVLKPDAAMYRAVLSALGSPAEGALFIDDSPANVAGALRVGMQAVHFAGTDALLHRFCLLGLPLVHQDTIR